MKILAIDFGMKRMGFAVGNTDPRTAAPIAPLVRQNEQQDTMYIQNLLDEYDIAKIIIGYPLNMDGSKSDVTLQVENFARQIKERFAIESEFVDERLTSFEAEEMLKEFQPDYKKRKKVLDSVSALVILRSYLESVGAL
ncbi:MAG: Holliday junction resolvase RuvX [Candidatus Aminicenantes bacterium]|nr:Holliday junction resolvase RuvX [Candidatus Aminicenantes bacterium]